MISLPLGIGVALGLLCATVIYYDARYMRIPNVISAGLLALFLVWLAVDFDNVALLTQLAASLIAFAICFLLFGLRLIGGGDAKVLPALMLFAPLAHLADLLLLFAALLIGSVVLVIGLRQLRFANNLNWRIMQSNRLPMGLAIGSTGILALVGGLGSAA